MTEQAKHEPTPRPSAGDLRRCALALRRLSGIGLDVLGGDAARCWDVQTVAGWLEEQADEQEIADRGKQS